MMNKKFLTMMFSLLLAVGWTTGAQAQKLENSNRVLTSTIRFDGHNEVKRIAEPLPQGQKFNAPMRSSDYLNAYVTHEKSWYDNQTPITWTDLQGNSHTTLLTEPVTDANGMIALCKRIYTDKTIPGAKYSAPQSRDIPYQTIQYGWDIIGTNHEDALVWVNDGNVFIRQIIITDPDGRERYNVTANSSNAPSGWESVSWDNYWYWALDTDNKITIPKSYLQNSQGYSHILVRAICYSSTATNPKLYIGDPLFGYYSFDVEYSSTLIYSATCEYDLPGTIDAPDYPGYTVMLVKLKDGVNESLDDRCPTVTENTDSLRNFFTKYVSEIQLLTDGLRVGSDEDAGTVFAYTGNLNKFFYISKGKMAFLSSLDILPDYDKAPFYSMYEEFSPAADSDTLNYTDFFEKLKQGTTYPIVHDCNSVTYFQHYFSMSGKKGHTQNRVNSVVLYIPDYRGGTSTDWRTYVTNHQPTVGMYMVDLFAYIKPSEAQEDYYTVSVEWFDNLDNITHTNGIPQTYTLYEIMDHDKDGVVDTIPVYNGPLTTYQHDFPVGDPTAYDITYYVVATPTQATNQDTFYAQSTPDNVTVPGTTDFLSLQWERYESDYVPTDAQHNEVNYYRNWLSPRPLSVRENGIGITKGNVGTEGRTLTLIRDDNHGTAIPVMKLELVMNGNKAYYRIKYINKEANQQVEPGYDPETGEMITNNNNN